MRREYRWYAAVRYRLTRLLRDLWYVLDRRHRITALTDSVYIGGELTPERVAFLRQVGVRAMVSLQAEKLDSMSGLDAHLWLPSLDGRPPSVSQLVLGARFVAGQVAGGKPVYIHCHAGVGRAPTMGAAYLVLIGATPSDALAQVQATRPWISMNHYQRQAVTDCSRLLASRQNVLET